MSLCKKLLLCNEVRGQLCMRRGVAQLKRLQFFQVSDTRLSYRTSSALLTTRAFTSRTPAQSTRTPTLHRLTLSTPTRQAHTKFQPSSRTQGSPNTSPQQPGNTAKDSTISQTGPVTRLPPLPLLSPSKPFPRVAPGNASPSVTTQQKSQGGREAA